MALWIYFVTCSEGLRECMARYGNFSKLQGNKICHTSLRHINSAFLRKNCLYCLWTSCLRKESLLYGSRILIIMDRNLQNYIRVKVKEAFIYIYIYIYMFSIFKTKIIFLLTLFILVWPNTWIFCSLWFPDGKHLLL